MFRVVADPDAFRRKFLWQVIGPIVGVIVVVGLCAGFALFWTTSRIDQRSAERQTEVVRRAVASTVDQLAYEQQGDAIWSPLVQELDRSKLNFPWLDQNSGAWLHRIFGHDRVYILNSQDKPVYAAIAGVRVAPTTQFEAVKRDIGPLIEAMRGRIKRQNGPHDRLPGQPLPSDSTVRTIATAVHASEALQVLGRPAAVSVMEIARDDGRPSTGRSDGYLMVSLRFLDGPYLQELGTRDVIHGLRYSHALEVKPGERVLHFVTSEGNDIGYFYWTPSRPGADVQNILAPVTALALLFLIAVMAWLAASLWRSGRELGKAVVELKASEAQAQHLAFHDVLTGLPNRALFASRLDQALARAKTSTRCALLSLDLDHFKSVNDTFGHGAGDALIHSVAQRLTSAVKERDTVARLGGDEFAILLEDVKSTGDVAVVCERLLSIIRAPFNIFGNEIFVGLSVGVAIAPDMADARDELARRSDIALYCAKAEGRSRYCFFEKTMDEMVQLRRQIESDLRLALADERQLMVHYQPQMAADGRTIIGLEALLRWHHPVRGQVPPEQFIPVAETTGLIAELGEWVFRKACVTAKKWPKLFVAVNLSPSQFRIVGFADRILQIVGEQGCEPKQIELEVTESTLVEDKLFVRREFEKLRLAGFRIALDDFGTGYSSLSYLRQFHVDKIKIDRSFTQNIGQDVDSAAIIRSVVALGHALGLVVAAEGVETPNQREFLAAAGCDELQGFLFSRPLSDEQVDILVSAQERRNRVA